MADYIYDHISTWTQPKESNAKYHAKKAWSEAQKATGAAANQAKDSAQELSFEAWLATQDMAGQGYDYAKEKLGEGAEYAREKAGEGAEYAREKAGEGAEYAREKAGEGAEYAREKAGEGAEYAREKAGEGAGYAREKAGEGAEYAREKASEGAGYAQRKAKEGAYDAKSRVVEGANDMYDMLKDRREANARRLRQDLETTWKYFSSAWEGAKDKATRQADWAKGYMEGKSRSWDDVEASGKEGIESLYARIKDNAAWGIGYFQGQLDEIDSTVSSTADQAADQATDWAGGVGEWMNSWLVTARDKAEGALDRAKVEKSKMDRDLQALAQSGKKATKDAKAQVTASLRDSLASTDRAARAAHQAAKEDTARAAQYIKDQKAQLKKLKGEMDAQAVSAREEALHHLEETVKEAEVQAKEAVNKAKQDRAEGERLLKSGGEKAWARMEELIDEQTERAWVTYDKAVRAVNDRAGNLRNEASYLGDAMHNTWNWLTSGWGHSASYKAREIQDQIHGTVTGSRGESAMKRLREAQDAMRAQGNGKGDSSWYETMGTTGYNGKKGGLFGSQEFHRDNGIPRYLGSGTHGSHDTVVSYTYAIIMAIAIACLAMRSYKLQKALPQGGRGNGTSEETTDTVASRVRRGHRSEKDSEKMSFVPDDDEDMQSHRSLKKRQAVKAQGDIMWAGALLVAFIPLAFLEASGTSRWFLCVFSAMQLLSLWARMRGQALDNTQMLRTSKTLLHTSLIAQAVMYLWHWVVVKIVAA